MQNLQAEMSQVDVFVQWKYKASEKYSDELEQYRYTSQFNETFTQDVY